MNNTTFGDWLKEQIAERCMTISEFARVAGIDLKTVQRWLYSSNLPRNDNVTRISNALSITRHEVLNALKTSIAA